MKRGVSAPRFVFDGGAIAAARPRRPTSRPRACHRRPWHGRPSARPHWPQGRAASRLVEYPQVEPAAAPGRRRGRKIIPPRSPSSRLRQQAQTPGSGAEAAASPAEVRCARPLAPALRWIQPFGGRSSAALARPPVEGAPPRPAESHRARRASDRSRPAPDRWRRDDRPAPTPSVPEQTARTLPW